MPFEKRVTLPGSERQPLPDAQPVGPIGKNETLRVTVVLQRQGPEPDTGNGSYAQVSRNDFSHPQPGAQQVAALKAAAPILVDEQLVKSGTDLNKVIDALIDPQVAQPVIASANNGAK